MQEIELDGVTYRTGRLTAFEQFHVFRKLTPMLAGLIETMTEARSLPMANGSEPPTLNSIAAMPGFWSAVGPAAKALSDMSTEDSEYVLKTCLKPCQRRNAGGQWAAIMTSQGQMMFEDMDLGAMLHLVYSVLEENLRDFFQGRSPTDSVPGIPVSR